MSFRPTVGSGEAGHAGVASRGVARCGLALAACSVQGLCYGGPRHEAEEGRTGRLLRLRSPLAEGLR